MECLDLQTAYYFSFGGLIITASFDAIDVAIGVNVKETIFLGLFSFDENVEVFKPAETVFPVLSMME